MIPSRTALALTMSAGLLAGCAQAGAETAAPPAHTSPPPQTIPYDLSTHCGIEEARIGTTYYEAVPPLTDGSHNPPEGWDNPTQRGTMTLISDTEAVFRDTRGHEVVFHTRQEATTFKHLCE
ncbi:hypothetical protein AB0M28_17705 [Streptomyces sp. NPDC051940]|uniref:hypothetical protein n=1 Tax=Streptomyces sp. NPDC051940 TaxID=3155675 RepID=UPI003415ECF5